MDLDWAMEAETELRRRRRREEGAFHEYSSLHFAHMKALDGK